MDFNILIDLLFVITSLYISIITIRTYVFATENHSAALYWGSSFALLFIMSSIYLITNITNYYSFQLCLAMHILRSFILMSQFKVAVQLYLSTRKHKYACLISRIIKVSYSIIFPIIFAYILMNIQLPMVPYSQVGLLGLQILGIFNLDLSFEVFHMTLAFLIFIILPWRYYFLHLQLGFLLLGFSKAIQIYNIISYDYLNSLLHQIEWSMVSVSMILFTIGIHHLYKKKAIKFRKLNEVKETLEE